MKLRHLGCGACLMALLALAAWQPPAWAARDDDAQDTVGTFGFGLESTGSACCISVRFWLADDRGSEMVINAYDTHLFVTVRGLQAVARLEPFTAYAGVGLTLRFGDLVVISPFSAFMSYQGFVAVSSPLPFFQNVTGNIEASVEARPRLGFSTSLGLGLHVYF